MFQWSDAWLLLALIYARDLSDREHLRAIGDYINHAIFSDDEIDGGLMRLMESGRAIAIGGRYAPSSQVLIWYDCSIGGKSGSGTLEDLERVVKFLGMPYA